MGRRHSSIRRSVGAAAVLLACAALGAATLEVRSRRSFVTSPFPTPVSAAADGASGALTEPARVALEGRATAAPSDAATIAIIGDSWAAGHKLDVPLARHLADMGLEHVEVVAFGHPGAKSRRILRNLLDEDAGKYSSAAVLEDDSTTHCIVVAGVNDTSGYIGSDFYAHHMIEIVKTLLGHGIRPLILEVPEYSIEHVPRSPQSAAAALLLRTLYDDGEVDVIARYRDELERQLVSSGLRGQVTMIEFDEVSSDYDSDASLYRDPVHLNDAGNEILAGVLAEAIARELEGEGS